MFKNLVFQLNKNLDKEMVETFLGLKQGGLDFSGCVLGPQQSLKKVLKMEHSEKKRNK